MAQLKDTVISGNLIINGGGSVENSDTNSTSIVNYSAMESYVNNQLDDYLIEVTRVACNSFVSATELQGYYYFVKGTPQYVIVSNLWQASTPVNQINNICTRMGYGGTGNRCQIYVYGGGFVDGHIVSVVLLGLIPKS